MPPLSKSPIIYITRDLERALGPDLNTLGYFIISNSTPFAKFILSGLSRARSRGAEGGVIKGHDNVLLVKEKTLFDTWELLKHSKTIKFIKDIGKRNVGILVFKNTLQIEKTCKENGWKLLNPPAELSNKVEEKISQIKYLCALKKYLPDYKITKCKNIVWNCKPCKHCRPCQPFILQFNRSHTGSGTILIESQKQLQEIQQKFPEREVRIAEYIHGPLFTNNNVVTKNKIMLGNISYQITGLKPFTNLPFSTIGNDWALPHKYLSKKQIAQYQKIATDVGKKLQKDGWRGLFGIDVVVNEKTGKLYLLEINCRQPASTTYESSLQVCKSASMQVTTFQAHLMALQNLDLKNVKLIEIKDGAQVILRVNSERKINLRPELRSRERLKDYKISEKLKQNNFKVIEYNNTEPNSDLLRIQSKTGIMERHNKFNKIGKKIIRIIN